MAQKSGDENYRKLECRESQIISQLSAEQCSEDFAARLFSKEVITERTYREGCNFGPHVVEADRMKVILDAVIARVKENPTRFETFIRVLRYMRLKDLVDFINRPLKDREGHKMAYVTDVHVISGSHAHISAPAGYVKNDVDLNKGAEGKYIYLCYKKGAKADAITGLQVIFRKHKSSDAEVPPGYVKLSQDLNQGAGGDYIYLCYSKTPQLPPIKGLQVIHGSSRVWPDPAYVKINVDLNKGAGGEYIFLCYRYD